MAFPKTQSGGDLMLEAPSPPEAGQYEELGLRFVGVESEDPATPPDAARPWRRSPRVAALLGASCLSFSGIFFRLSGTSPSTATLFRCLYALPLLFLLAGWRSARNGDRHGATA